jgi:hypothetical protein
MEPRPRCLRARRVVRFGDGPELGVTDGSRLVFGGCSGARPKTPWYGLAQSRDLARALTSRRTRARLQADLMLLPGLESFVPDLVLKRGRPLEHIPPPQVPELMRRTVYLGPVTGSDFRIPWAGGAARVIGLIQIRS